MFGSEIGLHMMLEMVLEELGADMEWSKFVIVFVYALCLVWKLDLMVVWKGDKRGLWGSGPIYLLWLL